MAAKSPFTEEQQEVIRAAAQRVWKKFKAEKKTQEDLALAVGLTQQSISNLLKGTYNPSPVYARAIANLDGKTLEQLIGDWATPEAQLPAGYQDANAGNFANLDICIKFYASTKHWSAWTIAAARAGFFGNADFAPPEWAGKLDALERALERERARKAG